MMVVHAAQGQGDLKATQYMLDKNVNPGQVIEELPLPKGGLEGTTYLFEHWYNGDIFLKNGKKILNYPVKMDLYNAILEVKGKDMVRICAFELIDQLRLYDPFENDTLLFVQAGRYTFANETPLSGLFQIIYRGKSMVFVYPFAEIHEATYVPAVDIGSRNDKIVIHRNYYFLGNEGRVVELAHSRKGNLQFFGDKAMEMKSYIKKNGLKFTDEDDLAAIFSYYDSLI
jgi:hypothetical protein